MPLWIFPSGFVGKASMLLGLRDGSIRKRPSSTTSPRRRTMYLSRATEYVMDSTSPGGDSWPSFSEATIRQVPSNRASSFLVASSEASRPDPVTSTPNATTIRNVLRIIHLPNSGEKGNRARTVQVVAVRDGSDRVRDGAGRPAFPV